ncbi:MULTISPECIES: hypothetical protein [unclassified Spirosoma]|uniref:hypothetical protein n=1 Tax=unclassified Spirosoma TaxID=2621999 RepID=UPI000964A59E|nr:MULTISPECIES: hypothetical protein [unclassified Spirosoma]MBN8822695.1 hypothetical protein [Spirosoma sp.]OJW79909.1 MAG: hypothetical protein BGO59_01460 [Spirosoma sp. 48-14]
MYTGQNHEGAAYFHQLPYEDQLNLIWRHGKLIEARRIPGFWLHLYAVNAFFVEMWICQRRYDVELLRVLDHTNELEPYIDKISLTGLLSY